MFETTTQFDEAYDIGRIISAKYWNWVVFSIIGVMTMVFVQDILLWQGGLVQQVPISLVSQNALAVSDFYLAMIDWF